MKPITALVIDGPAEGQIITTDRDRIMAYEQPTPDPTGTGYVQARPVTYTAQRFRIAGRMWNVLTTAPRPDLIDGNRVLLALIDGDPQDNRRCEVVA